MKLQLLALVLLAASAVSGCLSEETPPSDDLEQTSSEPNMGAPKPTESATTGDAEPAAPEMQAVHVEGDVVVTTVAVCPPGVQGCGGYFDWQGEYKFAVPKNSQDLVVTITWQAVNPTAESLHLAIVYNGDVLDSKDAQGTATFEFPGDVGAGEYTLSILPSPPAGAFFEQQIHWTSEYVAPV